MTGREQQTVFSVYNIKPEKHAYSSCILCLFVASYMLMFTITRVPVNAA